VTMQARTDQSPQPVDPLRGPDGVTESLLVRAHPGLCEGWGECHRWGPNVYPLDDEGRIDVHVLEVPPELAREAWIAAQACPARVISIVGAVRRGEAGAGVRSH